ncbi:hypothetical protein H0H81_001712 [Sphagnurus paluster]|uniref:Phosphoglycerate mutase n=1 Tax=Sphagnurus paluster TaxID=117069 RepID=A0A9P7GMW1_9AGAR|nr:hypothetical protein H0H81_001712 [Sphagnurus paluster]
MITVTFIRHGESEDNTKDIWAGWKDAPLSELGRQQAHALAHSLASTPLTHIYASPLLRALATGQAVHARQAGTPSFTVSPLLREQHFGIAEGRPWVPEIPRGQTADALMQQGRFPVLPGRTAKFVGGESLDDLAARADEAVRVCIVPHVDEGETAGGEVHVALASHGLCISELVAALLRLDPEARRDVSYKGLRNTAWTRAIVERRPDGIGLRVTVTDVNRSEHLAPLDAAQAQASAADAKRAFFGGTADNIPHTNAQL